jgi:putative hydrolase of the HAD superfamily
MPRYRAILFDLFGTVVLFKPKVPTLHVAGTTWRTTMGYLRDEVGEQLPDIPFDSFIQSIARVTEEIVRARPPEYREVLSPERFRRALASLGVEGELGRQTAERLSLRHMAHLAGNTEMPASHEALLRALKPQVRIGLISNFDHGPTAREILRRHGIEDLFDVTLISAEFGRRKPHPSIFEAALAALRVDRSQALYVGDTLTDDVYGAHGAGIDVAWISPDQAGVAIDGAGPTFVIRELTDLPHLLGA